ncbi:MAG TPA: nuclear transport factor 2 family protein [Dehalococcoidia bacterium]|nr:nuclear transport factor 2 family protein [Dehalococcoidia bacterium]
MGTEAEENKALIRHVFELADKEKKLDAVFNICDSNYVEHRLNNVELSLKEAKQEILDFPQYTDYSLTIDHLLADGDKVVYSVKHRYTLVETGEKYQLTSNGIFRIANGKIMEFWGLGGGVIKI